MFEKLTLKGSIDLLYECSYQVLKNNNYINIHSDHAFKTISAERYQQRLSIKFNSEKDGYVIIEMNGTSEESIEVYKAELIKIVKEEQIGEVLNEYKSTPTIEKNTLNKRKNTTPYSTVRKPWYKKRWLFILVSIFCPLVSIVLLWIYKLSKKNKRIIATIVLAVYTFFWGIIVYSIFEATNFSPEKVVGYWTITSDAKTDGTGTKQINLTLNKDNTFVWESLEYGATETEKKAGDYSVLYNSTISLRFDDGSILVFEYTLTDNNNIMYCKRKDGMQIEFKRQNTYLAFVPEPTPTPKPTAIPTPTISPTPKPTAKQSAKNYGSGTYKVGIDIPAGEYYIKGPGYVEVSSDSSGSLDSIIDNDNIGFYAYANVYDGQYLKLKGCSAIPSSSANPKYDGLYPSGMYKVGKDIPAGEYKVDALSNMGYYERNSGALGSDNSIIDNDNFSGSTYITINDGEFLKLNDCNISTH